MTDTKKEATGDQPRPPGEVLLEWLQANNRSQAWLARRASTSTKHINQIIKGHKGYSLALALRIAVVTGVDELYWWRVRANWEAAGKRLAEHDDDAARRAAPPPSPEGDA